MKYERGNLITTPTPMQMSGYAKADIRSQSPTCPLRATSRLRLKSARIRTQPDLTVVRAICVRSAPRILLCDRGAYRIGTLISYTRAMIRKRLFCSGSEGEFQWGFFVQRNPRKIHKTGTLFTKTPEIFGTNSSHNQLMLKRKPGANSPSPHRALPDPRAAEAARGFIVQKPPWAGYRG